MPEKQKTITKEISVSGVGLHTGEFVNLTFKPAPANHGFQFKRIDLENQPIVEASWNLLLEQTGARHYKKMELQLQLLNMYWQLWPV